MSDTHLQQIDAIEFQLKHLCDEAGISRADMYYYKNWTPGEQSLILKLLYEKCKVVQDEANYAVNCITNVVSLSYYRSKKKR